MQKFSSMFGLLLSLIAVTSLSAQSLDEIIGKSLQARGGVDKIKAITTMKISGKMSMGPMETPFTLQFKKPGKMRLDVSIQGMNMVRAYDGESGWAIMPFAGSKDPEKVNEEQVKMMREQADIDGPLVDSKEKGHTVELVGKEDVEGTEAWKMKLTLKSGDVRYVYIDPESFLEVKSEAKIVREGAEINVETYHGNYKEVEGLMMPFSIESRAKGESQGQAITIEKVELGVPMEDALFAMPPKTVAPEASK